MKSLLFASLCLVMVAIGCKTAKPDAPNPATHRAVVLGTNQVVNVAWDKSATPNVTYRVYYGSATHTYTNNFNVGTNLTATISNVISGVTYYVAATALSTNGQESAYSNEASYSVATPPLPPTNLRLTFSLQAGLNPSGPFNNVAVDPIIITNSITDPNQFYRLEISSTQIP